MPNSWRGIGLSAELIIREPTSTSLFMNVENIIAIFRMAI